MEQVAIRLTGDSWTYLGGNTDAKDPPEVVIRAFEGDVTAAIGSGRDAPDSEPTAIPEGEGRRLTGRHFFVRPTNQRGALASYRGL